MTSSAVLPQDLHTADCNPFDELDTVGLAELNAAAALQTRVDRKYLLAAQDLARLFGNLYPTARVLQINGRQHSDYNSTYFETSAYDSYLGAARSRPNRFKVRVRTYLDTADHYLEIKTRGRTHHTVKTRRPAEAACHEGLCTSDQAFVLETLTHELPARPRIEHAATVAALRPTLRTRYQRTTLLIEPDADAPDVTSMPSRATIDTSLAFAAPGRTHLACPGLALIETKTVGPPSAIDRLLWRSGHRPVKVSKFGIGLALFHKQLPANKWNRVLRRHFDWQPGQTDLTACRQDT